MVVGSLALAAGWYGVLVYVLESSSPTIYVVGLLVGLGLLAESARTTVTVGNGLVAWRAVGLFSPRRIESTNELRAVRIDVHGTGKVRLLLEFTNQVVGLGPWEPGFRERLLANCESAVDVLREAAHRGASGG